MIKKIDNIILLGTSHVAKQSAKEIKETIEKEKPEVVAIELDLERFQALMSKSKEDKKKSKKKYNARKEIGLSGYLFAKLAGYVQEKVGESLGIDPGVDMKTAYLEARKHKIPVSLIDIPIKKTLKKMSALSFKRKVSMFSSLVFKSFKKEHRNKLNFDVKKGVPDEKVIIEMLKIVEKEVPDMYKILIEDRNVYMAERLLRLKESHDGPIIAVLGAGHLDGMYKYLTKKLNNDSNSINFSFVAE